ncbi:hypothetical protein BFF78_12215 [Streptomyces fodineus]|uniref:Vegetative cell wall protein gp1 n=1 Tax=Streptomyces fodineus TaxID=1904616 RepID=A0A1D7Y883_9ACTN|nr:hypothetical protein [Streptomyces fodineus]AOR31714.1 hypothetical protein BFF78_12215 [Streptomyces fodineus]
MTAWVASLGGKLAERWLATLVLPGVVFVCGAAVTARLGQRHWADVGLVRSGIDRFAVTPAAHSNGAVLLMALAAVVLAAAASAAAQALGQLVVRLWTGTWGRCGGPLVRRRQRRWDQAAARYEAALREKARRLRGVHPSPSATPVLPDTASLAAVRDRIALIRPRLPTWTGDRMVAVDEHIRTAYDLDLATVWPRLWLTLPEEVRAPLTQAQAGLTAAARTAAWGGLWLALGPRWWPAALIGAGGLALGWWRGRTAMEHLAQLVESTVDLHAAALAKSLGHPVEGPFGPADGEAVTRILRKGY